MSKLDYANDINAASDEEMRQDFVDSLARICRLTETMTRPNGEPWLSIDDASWARIKAASQALQHTVATARIVPRQRRRNVANLRLVR